MFRSNWLSITSVFVFVFCSGCGGGGGSSDDGGGTTANSAPIFSSGSSATVAESQLSAGYTATATDANGDSISFNIDGGDDAALFEINSTTGVLSFLSAPVFSTPSDSDTNNAYQVSLEASDGTDSTTLALTITIIEQGSQDSLGLTDIELRDSGAALVADFYAPAAIVEKLSEERTVSWSEIIEAPVNLTRFSFGDAGTDDVFAMTDASDSVDASLSISASLAIDTEVDNDLLLRSMFQFVEVSTGEYAIYSVKHGNYALDVATDGTSLILRDVRSLAAYNSGTASFLTFSVGTSPLTLVANGRYLFDAADSAANNTLAFDADAIWVNQEVLLSGSSLELAGTGTSMKLYGATIALDIPFDFAPEQPARVANIEYFRTNVSEGDLFATGVSNLDTDYQAQVAESGAAASTLSAAETMLDTIEAVLAGQNSQTRYPREFYLALRDGLLSRILNSEESLDADLGSATVPYVYFTNEVDGNGDYHPFMVIASHGLPDALALLGDVPRPPGDGLGTGGYATENVTRSFFRANFLLRIPMRDYGEVATLTENVLDRSLAGDVNEPNFDHHNYASTGRSAVAVDGVIIYPAYNNRLSFSQAEGELSARGFHSGRGLDVHYHADPHSAATLDATTDTGLNLYNEDDYTGRDHPPVISIGFDGVAGYGFYLDGDTTSDGVNLPLDDFAGHEHDGYGYHYHALRTARQTDPTSTDYSTHELGPLGAWAGRINDVPEFLDTSNRSQWTGNP